MLPCLAIYGQQNMNSVAPLERLCFKMFCGSFLLGLYESFVYILQLPGFCFKGIALYTEVCVSYAFSLAFCLFVILSCSGLFSKKKQKGCGFRWEGSRRILEELGKGKYIITI